MPADRSMKMIPNTERKDMMFGKKKVKPTMYDKEKQRPVIRASICTGEQVAGFKDRDTDKFNEIMLIRDAKDLSNFCREYGVDESEITKEY